MKFFTEVLDATLTLTTGTEDSDKPLNNLLSRVKNKVFGIDDATAPVIKIDFGAAKTCDYIMITNIDGGTDGSDDITISLDVGAADNGSDFDANLINSEGMGGDDPYFNFFGTTSKRYWRITVSNIDDETIFRFGLIFMGVQYETPRASNIPIKIGNDFNVFSNTIGNIDYTSVTGLSTDNKTNADNYFERGLKFNRFTEVQLETFRAEIKDNLNGVQKPFYVECEDGEYRLVYIENMYMRYGKKNKDDYGFTLNLKELV